MDPKYAAFESCLQYVLEGASIEDALAHYPVWADELRPMVKAALAARQVGRDVHVPRGALLRSRAQLLRAAAEVSVPRQRSRLNAPLRWSFAALIVLVLLVFGGFTTVAIAAQALPGEALYGVKILTEKARLELANDPAQQLKLQQTFDRERAEEVDELIARGRSTSVSFVGGLEEMGPDIWRVSDINVLITASTQIERDIKEGFHIGVEGTLQPDGSVAASRVWDRRFRVSGLTQVIARRYWVVDNVQVAIGDDTVFSGAYGPGSRVIISAGKLLNGQLMARSVEILTVPGVVLSTTDTPVPTHTVSPTVIPTETRISSPTSVPQERATATEVEKEDTTETPGPTEEGGEEARNPEPTEEGGDEAETPEPTEAEDETPEPTEAEDETPEPTEEEEEEAESPEPTASQDDREGGGESSGSASTPESGHTEVETEEHNPATPTPES